MPYGLMTYRGKPGYNIGDYIQSLAAAQFLPQVDTYINREELPQYNGEPLKLIMNGWFMHEPDKWPPSTHINPLLVSFHLNALVKEKMLCTSGIEWFRKHGPVGCRDQYTLDAMINAGIKAYLSGCLTTTLKPFQSERTTDIYFADVLFNIPQWKNLEKTPREIAKFIKDGDAFRTGRKNRFISKIFSRPMVEQSISVTHSYGIEHSEEECFKRAKILLDKYAAAKLVITSRLHCALPCLAFGTPVIFIHYGFKNSYDPCRLEGVTDLFNTIYIAQDESITANFDLPAGLIDENISIVNPDKFRVYVKGLRDRCTAFVNETEAV